MSREEKLQAMELLQERRRRELKARPGYTPHEGQSRVHKSVARERWVLCGNGWGKTSTLVQEVHAAATGWNPWQQVYTKVPARIIVILDSPEKVKAQFLYEYKKWFTFDEEKQMHKDGKPHYVRMTYDNGSEVTFMFHDQSEMKFEGITDIHFIAADEPMPRFLYIALYRGTREKGSEPRLLMCGTAINQGWIRREVWQPWSRGDTKNIECFQFNSEQNRANLRSGFLEEFASKLSEAERRVRLAGGFFDAEGLALAHLIDPAVHKCKPFDLPADWPCLIICDPHPKKQHTFLLLACSPDDQVYVVDEWASRLVPSQLALALYERWGEHRIVDLVSDSLGSSELTGGWGNLSFIQVLNKVWKEEEIEWRIRPTTYQEKQDEAWIQLIQEFLIVPLEPDNFGQQEPKLKVFEHCRALWFDLENVAWFKYRHSEEVKPKLDMVARDFLSCLKYGLAARPTYRMDRRRVLKSGRSPWSGPAGSHRPGFAPKNREDDDSFDEF